MEGMFSLGNVGLWRMANNGYMSLTGVFTTDYYSIFYR